jgi:hypothetical protein
VLAPSRAWTRAEYLERTASIEPPPAPSHGTRGPATELLAAIGEPLAWQRDGLCAEYPQSWWFPERGEDASRAVAVCARCLVRDECLAYALEQGAELHGVWGGTSALKRRQMRSAGHHDPRDERLVLVDELRAQGRTQVEIAAELGIDRSTVHRYVKRLGEAA